MIVRETELYHHGVRGQKWGIRRYQKADGSLTLLGRYRQNKINKTRNKNLKKARATKAAKKAGLQVSDTKKTKPKSISEMTDAELRTAIDRKKLEDDYRRAFPQKVSKGKAFANKVISDVLAPSLTTLAKQAVTSAGAKFLNDNLIPQIAGVKKLTDSDREKMSKEELERYERVISEYKIYANNKK